MKQTISIIILTHRHDEIFEKSLASAQWADEVLVIDHNSQNNWPQLLKKYSFQVLNWKTSPLNFSEVRNWAALQASQEWLFFLDSDEVISLALQQEILAFIQNSREVGAKVYRQDIFLNRALRYGEAGNIQLTRLVKKGHGQWQHAVHEELHISGTIHPLSSSLEHYSHQSITEFVHKINKYSRLRAVDIQTQNLSHLVQSLLYPTGKFFVNYCMKQGFRDGFRGLMYAVLMSVHSLSVRVHHYELKHAK